MAEPDPPSIVTSQDKTSSVPSDLGTVIDSFQGKEDKPTVFYIQDAHSILNAQRAIQGLLANLEERSSVRLIALEGASGPLDTDLLRSYPEIAKLEKALWSYGERGEISGAEIQSVLGPRAVFHGVEDKELYLKSLRKFREAHSAFDQDQISLDAVDMNLEALSKKFFSPGLLQLMQSHRSFETGTLSLSAFLAHLRSFGLSREPRYPALSQMVGALAQEENIEKDPVLYRKLLEWMKRQFQDSPETNRLKQAFETSRATLGDTIRALRERRTEGLTSEEELLLQAVASQKELESISGTALMEELDRWVADKEGSLAQKDPHAEKVLKMTRQFRLLKKFLSLEVSSQEWSGLAGQLALCEAKSFEDFFKEFGIALTLRWDPKPAAEFYQLASQRDGVLFRNLEGLVQDLRDPEDVVILVTGGFHTVGISKLLKDKGFSYVTVSPKFQPGGENPYLKVMMGQTSYQVASVSSIPPPLTFEKGSPYHEPMVENLAREILPQEGTPAYYRSVLEWLNQLVYNWRRDETDRDISSSVKTLRTMTDTASQAGTVTGRSLGGEEKKGTRIFKVPDVLNTSNVQRDVFNFMATLLEDIDYAFGRSLVFLVDEKDGKPISVSGYMGFDTSILNQSGEFKAPTKEKNLEEILEKRHEEWKRRGRGGNLYPLETMVKGYQAFLATDQSLIAQSVNTKKTILKKIAPNEKLDDPLAYSFEMADMEIPSEFVLVPMVHNNKVVGVVYADDFGKDQQSTVISPDRVARLEVFANSAAKSIVSSRAFEEVQYRSTHDFLTDLLTRTGVQEPFREALEMAVHNKEKISFIVSDLDYFKNINDNFGHPAGDQFIKDVGKIIRGTVRYRAFPARLGGDEFLIVLPHTNTHDAYQIAENLRKNVRGAKIAGVSVPKDFKLSISAGVSTFGAVSVGDGYVALIPYTHDERAAKIVTQLTNEIRETRTAGTSIALGERVVRVGSEDFTVFLFDERGKQVGLKEQVNAVQNRAYDVIFKHADTAASISKKLRNRVTTFSVEVQKAFEEAKESAALKTVRLTAQEEFRKFPAAAHKLNREGVILDVTDKWLELLGYERDEVVGKEVFDFLPPQDRALAKANHLQRMGLPRDPLGTAPAPEGSQNVHLTRYYLRKDGSRVLVTSEHSTLTNIETGMTAGVTTVLHEANLQKFLKKRARLDHSEIAFDKRGIVFLASRGLLSRLGYVGTDDSDKFEGKPVIDLFPEEERPKVKEFLEAPDAPNTSLHTWMRSAQGLKVELIMRKGKDKEYSNITTINFVFRAGETAGKSLGSPEGRLPAPDDLNSLGGLLSARTSLRDVSDSASDLWAKQFFSFTGVPEIESDREAGIYLEGKGVGPFFFNEAIPARSSSLLVLDLDSLLKDAGVLARMAELVGENGKILPFITEKTTPETLEQFKKQTALLTKRSPGLGAKLLKIQRLIHKKLDAQDIATIRQKNGLAEESLGLLVSSSDILRGDFSALTPPGKEAVAFQFEARSNYPTLSKAVYSIAFSAFLNGSKNLNFLNETFVKKDQRSGIPLFSFDLVELAATLTAEWHAETAILRAA